VSAIRRLPNERTHTEVGVFSDEASARAAMRRLTEEGFAADDIGLVETPRRAAEVPASRMPQNAAVGAAVGAIVALVIAVGPASGYLPEPRWLIVAIIASMGLFAGGLVGFYAGRYFPQRDPEVYQDKLDRGGVLVTVSCGPADRERARDALQRAGATSVREEPAAQTP
jgi:hypothetical protein